LKGLSLVVQFLSLVVSVEVAMEEELSMEEERLCLGARLGA
jgi:hypothetical protein